MTEPVLYNDCIDSVSRYMLNNPTWRKIYSNYFPNNINRGHIKYHYRYQNQTINIQ